MISVTLWLERINFKQIYDKTEDIKQIKLTWFSGAVFLSLVLPETRNLTLQQIEQFFNNSTVPLTNSSLNFPSTKDELSQPNINFLKEVKK